MQEVWLPIANPLYTDKYDVSDQGHIRNKLTGKILHGHQPPGKPRKVELRDKFGVEHNYNFVHILVYTTFVGPIPAGYGVGFKEGHSPARSNLVLVPMGVGQFAQGRKKANVASQKSYREQLSVEKFWDGYFHEACPETMKILKKPRRDYDALWMNLGRALVGVELGEWLEEKEAA